MWTRTLSTSQTSTSSPGSFHCAGVDLGQKRDHSAIAVVEKKGGEVSLVHLKRFPLGTEYGSVIGYLKALDAKLGDLRRVLIDQTGVGEVFVEDARKSALKQARGIMLSLPVKQEVMVYLKESMQNGQVHIPYDREFMNELNVERYVMTKTGQVQFSHPGGTHDDRLWALALAVYVSRPEVPEYHPVSALGKIIKASYLVPSTKVKRDEKGNERRLFCLTCGKLNCQEHSTRQR